MLRRTAIMAASAIACLAQTTALQAGAARVDCRSDTTCRSAQLTDVMASASRPQRLQECARGECTDQITRPDSCESTPRFWMRVEELKVQNKVTAMRQRAATGAVLQGFRIAEIISQPPNERHFARCAVRQIAGSEGPPTECETVAIETPGAIYVKAIIPQASCNAMTSLETDGATINIDFDIDTRKAASAFSEPIKAMLKNELELEFRQRINETSSFAFSGIAPMRNSKVLGGSLREAFNFDVWLTKREGKGYALSAQAKPMICSTAAGNAIEYHGLNDGQKETYAKSLEKSVSAAIAKGCTTFHPVDRKTLICE
jgi:hypothetical protein